MSWIGDIFKGAAGGIIKEGGELAKHFITTDKDRHEFEVQLEQVVTERIKSANAMANTEMDRKAAIIQAEMAQSDAFTKRARPAVVYWGMLLITAQIAGQFFGINVILPEEFWYSWSGLVGTWIMGRSYEKGGGSSKASELVTGKKGIRELLQ
ncbi:hypothetical protein KAR91_72790 [Candidatus Pacearchaeota archaeon]|nr:hypothetical protein [Candidatus Pacearchaeota archaeon]